MRGHHYIVHHDVPAAGRLQPADLPRIDGLALRARQQKDAPLGGSACVAHNQGTKQGPFAM